MIFFFLTQFKFNNKIGLISELIQTFTNAWYIILSQRKQEELGCTPFQLLLFEAPSTFLTLILFAPILENYSLYEDNSIWNTSFHANDIV